MTFQFQEGCILQAFKYICMYIIIEKVFKKIHFQFPLSVPFHTQM